MTNERIEQLAKDEKQAQKAYRKLNEIENHLQCMEIDDWDIFLSRKQRLILATIAKIKGQIINFGLSCQSISMHMQREESQHERASIDN